ncbi:flagellar export chaperone FliS [Rariglobus hedericola]|uniref:Flagellar secretion chaperone FliS n=1 Tax=Rariglobus hedericola TaxID=2597822 RepID=A0A556QPL5_9BACT|nr:flagellar export chaperone FliS [Rariglobus hedericola]TSJ78584.1 flagellar export chaperone FliS [Rariglobus hedericola]
MNHAHEFARIYQAQAVLTTNPGNLVLMLYDGATRFINQAIDADSESDETVRIQRMHTYIVKAQNILIELRANLDFNAGGDYARDLDRLYDYYIRRLMQANLQKSTEPLNEVIGLLGQLRSGWAEMLLKQSANEPVCSVA